METATVVRNVPVEELIDEDSPNESLIKRAILGHPSIPSGVADSEVSHIELRKMTRQLYESLCASSTVPADDDRSSARLAKRRESLRELIGTRLLCAVVPLPGALYTIEVDPRTEAVVHWEWQSIGIPKNH